MSTRDRTVDDRSLVARAAWGDVESFTKLVRTPSSLVYRVARMLGSEDAQDVSQELWVRVWRNIKGFRGESVFSTWLYRITMNMCLSMRQRESRREGCEYSGEEIEATLGLVRAERRAGVATHGGSLLRGDSEVLGVPDGTAKGWVSRGWAAPLMALAQECIQESMGEGDVS